MPQGVGVRVPPCALSSTIFLQKKRTNRAERFFKFRVMASVTKENLGNLHDKLTVKVSKEDYLPAFEKAIKSYSKKANIPGF